MQEPLISIIIPVLNAEQSLERAIQSAIQQTYPHKEIIIIDGGSTDSSIEVIHKYQSQLAHFLSEPDHGVYDAINKGLDRSLGQWIFILGSDDAFASPHVLDELLLGIGENDRLIFGSVRNEHVQHKLVPAVHHSSFGPSLRWKNTLHQQSVLYHRSLFNHFRFDFALKVLADYDFHLYLLRQNTPYIQRKMVVAHCDASGLSKQFRWPLYREELHIKRRRLSTFYYLLNIPWVCIKFMSKRWLK